MPARKIKILGFRYIDEEGYDRMARQGQTVELSDEDAARGDADGCFVVEDAEADESLSIGSGSTDEELLAFVKDAKVGEVVDAADGDADFAQRLLEAENDATGNEPRSGVAKGLAAVVGTA